jgi:hypothetical protein
MEENTPHPRILVDRLVRVTVQIASRNVATKYIIDPVGTIYEGQVVTAASDRFVIALANGSLRGFRLDDPAYTIKALN